MKADDILGKTVLVGLTHRDARGNLSAQQQFHGVVVAIDTEVGVTVEQPSGEILTLPPDLDAFTQADPGEYTLRNSGEVVTDPDLLCTWTITAPGDDQWSDEDRVDLYRDRRDLYRAFANRLEDLLETLFDERGISYSWVIDFTVDPSAFKRDLDDARRGEQTVEDPFARGFRLAGVIVGVASGVELEAIEELIESEFDVDQAGSSTLTDTATRRRPGDAADGYEYPSYLVQLDERRAELAEWSSFADLTVRIEVRTLLQDAWRSVADELPFRTTTAYPVEIRSLLSKAVVGVQAADADLTAVVESLLRLVVERQEAVAAGEIDLPLDGASLVAYVQASDTVRSLAELGPAAGLRYDPDDSPDWDDIEDSLLWLLWGAGVENVTELDAFLQTAKPRAHEVLAQLAQLCNEEGFTPWALREDVVEWLWLVLHRADAGTVARMAYRDEIRRALDTLIGNPAETDS